MSASAYRHLSYLQQISDILEDLHKPLAAKYGFISKKIAQKQLIHVSGQDGPKLRRCKACYAPITFDDIKVCNNNGLVTIKCSLCGTERRYPITNIKNKNKRKLKTPRTTNTHPSTSETQTHVEINKIS